MSRLFIKDESSKPTGSFKARGLCAAVSMARQLGIRKLAIPSAGNAAGAMAAYAANAGLESRSGNWVKQVRGLIVKYRLAGGSDEG